VALLTTLLIAGFSAQRVGAAATLEARWSLYGRANATSFQAGATGVAAPGAGAGYEIVSFDGVGISTGLATYVYGGPDLPPAHGGPIAPIVTCNAAFTATEMFLTVDGAYPYAGCVFFLGVQNTGDTAFRVRLGGLDEHATVTCDAPGCLPSDVDLLGGGANANDVAALCREFGGSVTAVGADIYSVPPGATFVCPLFVTVLQPAKEGATYVVVISPPPPETRILIPLTIPSPTNTPTRTIAPKTDPTATPTPTPTATPIAATEGEKTPGPATPQPPRTGNGIVLRGGRQHGYDALTALLFLGALGAGVLALRK
jgi:hypothetical protein